ncbi:hypothetical protein [Tsukamurella paurometabola]|uniref:Uncharacterized protein n=1 Tax=Tsukamurella paurometabola TaxID=2061 RepID=A0A3P8L445_TSUPA|nr:hypothetical protein [Tsukamurella paurometabola]UEA83000.1 hypothetical protein LK411_22030 [Tsukamurella paurometabola]VDR40085.1 Uncharacterised protein [Tsukamurella paurometabola]
MTERRRITLQLDGHQQVYIGNSYEVRESGLGLYEVWDTAEDRCVWSEKVHHGIREVRSVNIDTAPSTS